MHACMHALTASLFVLQYVNENEWPMHNLAMRRSVHDVLSLAKGGNPGISLDDMRNTSPQQVRSLFPYITISNQYL